MGFNDPKEFNDTQVLNDPKGISIGNMDFDNPKVYGDTSVFDGLVFSTTSHSLTLAQVVQKTFFCIFANYQDHPHGPVLCEEDGRVGFFFCILPKSSR